MPIQQVISSEVMPDRRSTNFRQEYNSFQLERLLLLWTFLFQSLTTLSFSVFFMVSLKILTLLSWPDSNWSPLECYLFWHPNRENVFPLFQPKPELIKGYNSQNKKKKGTYNKSTNVKQVSTLHRPIGTPLILYLNWVGGYLRRWRTGRYRND